MRVQSRICRHGIKEGISQGRFICFFSSSLLVSWLLGFSASWIFPSDNLSFNSGGETEASRAARGQMPLYQYIAKISGKPTDKPLATTRAWLTRVCGGSLRRFSGKFLRRMFFFFFFLFLFFFFFFPLFFLHLLFIYFILKNIFPPHLFFPFFFLFFFSPSSPILRDPPFPSSPRPFAPGRKSPQFTEPRLGSRVSPVSSPSLVGWALWGVEPQKSLCHGIRGGKQKSHVVRGADLSTERKPREAMVEPEG